MGNEYYICCKDCKKKYRLGKDLLFSQYLLWVTDEDLKERKKYLDKLSENTKKINVSLKEVPNRVEKFMSDEYYFNFNMVLFILKHSGHNLFLYYDAGKVFLNIDKWFEGKMKITFDDNKEFPQDYWDQFEDDYLFFDKKFKGYKTKS